MIDEKRLFSETDLIIIHTGLVKMRTIDNDLTQNDLKSFERLVDEIEDIIPELQRKEKVLDFSWLFNNLERDIER